MDVFGIQGGIMLLVYFVLLAVKIYAFISSLTFWRGFSAKPGSAPTSPTRTTSGSLSTTAAAAPIPTTSVRIPPPSDPATST